MLPPFPWAYQQLLRHDLNRVCQDLHTARSEICGDGISAPSSLAVIIQPSVALTTSSTFRNQQNNVATSPVIIDATPSLPLASSIEIENIPPHAYFDPRNLGPTMFYFHADNFAIQLLPADSLNMAPRTCSALGVSDGTLANPFGCLYGHLPFLTRHLGPKVTDI